MGTFLSNLAGGLKSEAENFGRKISDVSKDITDTGLKDISTGLKWALILGGVLLVLYIINSVRGISK
jgi:hypothetical protein